MLAERAVSATHWLGGNDWLKGLVSHEQPNYIRVRTMTELTLQLPDELAERIGRSGRWAPAILGLSLDGYGTRAVAVANEIIAFLSTNPAPADVLGYHVAEAAQDRLRRLLALNAAGLSSQGEQTELDELERIEHLVVLLKAQVAAEASPEN